ncbi:MAG TPA: hypothetical protein DIW64_05205 [Cellvibrio sp.]|nr:hypothetical protein [Cellvibrio sp.]
MININSTKIIGYLQKMFEMKVITSILFITVLSGCTSQQSAYRAAKGEGSGYKDVALAENHYRVQFKINGPARKAAQKYALVRASELTIAQGYDWFVVENRTLRTLNEPDLFESTPSPIATRNCGLLGCRTQTQLPAQPMDVPDTETFATMEIRMGRGVRPEKESYDAREIWEAHQKENNAQSQ